MRFAGKAAATALVGIATGVAILAPAAPAVTVKQRLPGPGQTTVTVAQLRFTGKAPRQLRLKVRNRAKLGPSLRGIYAVYRKRRGRTTALTVVSLLLRKNGEATASAAPPPVASGSEESLNEAMLVYFFLESGFVDEGYKREAEDTTGDLTEIVATEVLGDEAPIEQAPKLERLLEYGGVKVPPDSSPGKLGENLLDTGHYDDGHAFGWNSAGTKGAIGSWLNLTAGTGASYEQLIEEIESRLEADLDGDGKVDEPGSGGGTIDTEVGVPVIR